MNAMMAQSDEWMMGGSKDPALFASYGVTEAEVAAIAVESIFYAQSKACGNRGRFAMELTDEFFALLCERLGVEVREGDDVT
jgi:hypothetical protein